MKEVILHYLWLHKRIDVTQLYTTKGEKIEIIRFGDYLQTSGPDFFNAQLIINNQKWVGTVEMHVQSSDWYLHHHEKDANYDNVILHVVWSHNAEVYRKNNTEIPVLELQSVIEAEEIARIQYLLKTKTWIYCENSIKNLVSFLFLSWKERLFFERLEQKSKEIEQLVLRQNKNWEAVCFSLLAKNFGLNTNGETFLEIINTIPFSVLQKESYIIEHLEALFFGYANLLSTSREDDYVKKLKENFNYLKHKYQLPDKQLQVQFYKLRPSNFPTIRLSQLAMLFYKHKKLFLDLVEATTKEKIYSLFNSGVSPYWETHYNFDTVSKKTTKKLTKSFINLLIINTIIPLQYTYKKSIGLDVSNEIITLLSTLQPEKNTILEKFVSIGISNANAFDSQSLLQLKKNYCNQQKCLKCAVGVAILKNK